MEAVSGAFRPNAADEGCSGYGQVSDEVQDLVADGLVGKPQGRIQDRGLVKDQSIVP